MPENTSELMRRAIGARDKLVEQWYEHSDVTLIDIGLASEGEGKQERIVVRIHLGRETSPEESLPFPQEVNGIPVVVIRGEYRPENDP